MTSRAAFYKVARRVLWRALAIFEALREVVDGLATAQNCRGAKLNSLGRPYQLAQRTASRATQEHQKTISNWLILIGFAVASAQTALTNWRACAPPMSATHFGIGSLHLQASQIQHGDGHGRFRYPQLASCSLQR